MFLLIIVEYNEATDTQRPPSLQKCVLYNQTYKFRIFDDTDQIYETGQIICFKTLF
jgi:hypothetical protein